MRECVKNWKHKKGKNYFVPFLECLRSGIISDEEYEYIKKNSDANFIRHSDLHLNPVRLCLEKVHKEENIFPDKKELQKIDEKFFNGNKRINLKSFLDRISCYPLDDNFFEKFINLDENNKRTKNFSKDSSASFYESALKIVEIAKEIRNNKKRGNVEKVLFCRITSMNYYQGMDDEKPQGGGSYIEENLPHERFNFKKNNGVIRGFVQSSAKNGGMNLSRINPETLNDNEKLDNVLVIFVADGCIVGYYKGATVFSSIQNKEHYDQGDYTAYNIKIESSRAVLLSKDSRTYKIPKEKGGMGQSNVFYIYDDKGNLRQDEWIRKAINYVLINKLVKSYIPKIVDYCNANPSELNELTNNNFGTTSYSMLKTVVEIKQQDEGINNNAQTQNFRYWADIYSINNQEYRFHSQWGGHGIWNSENSISLDEKHRNSFIYYLKEKGIYQANDIIQAEIKGDKKMKELLKLKNQILYGTPGTGKTYSTVSMALEILDASGEQKEEIKSIGKLKAEFGTQVEFVTFHQSFSYEDFVEGLKASTDNGKITYKIEDGVFKEICKSASSKAEIINNSSVVDRSATIWKMSLGNSRTGKAQQYLNEAIETNSLILGYGGIDDFSECNNREEVHSKLGIEQRFLDNGYFINRFKNEMEIGDIVIISDGNYKFKAIVKITGDYYFDEESDLPQKRKIEWLQRFSESKPVLEISERNFTQTTINKPKHINREKLQQYLAETQTGESNKKPHVLIIDEINRGNISRIFGELITLIEPSKRAGAEETISVKLPYSKEDFSVPDNLYIIGTMNTADRSLTLMDTALRRRFDFVEKIPELERVKGIFDGINVKKILKTINHNIEILYDKEHLIGHSFLMNIDNIEQLRDAFKNKILPLLEEYFYDDFEKINLVLGGNSFYKKENKTLGEINKDIYQKQDIKALEPKAFSDIYAK